MTLPAHVTPATRRSCVTAAARRPHVAVRTRGPFYRPGGDPSGHAGYPATDVTGITRGPSDSGPPLQVSRLLPGDRSLMKGNSLCYSADSEMLPLL